MTTIKDSEGNDVEVLTQEEVDAKLAEQKTAFETQLGEKDTALSAAQKDADDAKAALEKAGAGSGDFKTLKEALDRKNEAVTNIQKELDEVKTQRVDDYKVAALDKLVGKDEELRKKVEHHFAETLKGVKADKPEEILSKLENALKLSVDIESPNALDLAGNGGGRGEDIAGRNAGAVEFGSKEKALGSKLGVSQEDYKKYGDDPRLKGMLK